MSGFNKEANKRTETCACDCVTASQRDASQMNEQNVKVGCKVR